MYIVTLKNGGRETVIHGEREKLFSGKVVKGINAIDSCTFALLPSNIGFAQLNEYKTLVDVYNTNKKRYEFHGRVLYAPDKMSESGLLEKEATCESIFGYFCDSQQPYVDTQNWTVEGLLQFFIDNHNAQVEEEKRFVVGEVTATDPNDNLYLGIQRENTWEAINSKLIKKIGGELRYRVVDGINYIDYLERIGETKSTAIELTRNMKSITREKDPTEYVTRLIPLGCKFTEEVEITDADGNVTTQTVEKEERLDITSVNDGINYIDDEAAKARFGIRVGYAYFDNVTEADNLLSKGKSWLVDNNKILVKYSITALDLSLLGLDIDDFEVHNSHPLRNHLLGINDTARIIKKSIDICEEVKSTIEVGDNFKTLSDFQIEQAGKIENTTTRVEKIESDYVTNNALESTERTINSLIKQTAERISLMVTDEYVSKADEESYRQSIETELSVLSNEILMKFTTVSESVQTVDGELQTKFEELYKYISFKGGNITLGEGGNAITLTIENDVISFKRNGVEFGSWDGENFYTGNIIIRLNQRFQFGNFAFLPRSDGSAVLLKVGG